MCRAQVLVPSITWYRLTIFHTSTAYHEIAGSSHTLQLAANAFMSTAILR
jgi:hypothetical protein